MPKKSSQAKEPMAVRTRFAPSPSGFLHIGSARTALFNYLFAKNNNGTFILRIEDTNEATSKKEYEQNIIESLNWLGILWDEGPIAPAQTKNLKLKIKNYTGNYGSYRQSERSDIYKKYLEQLLSEDKIYHCFCSEDELEAQRQYQASIGESPRYSGKCARLNKKEIQNKLSHKEKSILRFRVPAKIIKFKDLIRGEIEFDAKQIGDFSVAKDIHTPLYNFAVAIDDFEMKISHVIRGEDLISSTPRQILIQEVLSFPIPQYAHLPLILGPDRSKLSKRHQAEPISEFKRMGYLPEALVNFIAFLGWNPGDEREIYSLLSLTKEFSIDRIQKGGAVFNIQRLDFLNGFYIRQRSVEKLTKLCIPYLIGAGLIEPLNGSNNRIV